MQNNKHFISHSFGYDLTAAALLFFEKYFEIKFPLPKIDLVAVPDFGFQAMENWGLITYRESAFIVQEIPNKIPSASHMRSSAKTNAHETAHQWFGNLVTMKWYDDLWLKEGFATYLSYIAVDKIKPSWNHFETISLHEYFDAMNKDSDVLSHAISFKVKTKSDVRRVFDPISYSKGAVIINMMRAFLGEVSFRSGLKRFLKKFAYGNALQDNLWQCMTSETQKVQYENLNFTIKQIMDSWTVISSCKNLLMFKIFFLLISCNLVFQS
jgi:aminopeptidase N